jgi:ribose transport system permease protein
MSVSAPALAADPDKLEDGDRRRFAAWLARSSLRFGSYVAFAAVLLVFAWRAPSFLSIDNMGNILGQSAILGVLAFGMTIVIVGGGSNVVTGGIDLSLAGNMGLSAGVYAALIQAGFGDAVAATASLGAGAAIGAVNAISVVALRILPLLSTPRGHEYRRGPRACRHSEHRDPR